MLQSPVQPLFPFEADPLLSRVRAVLRRTVTDLPAMRHMSPVDQLVRSELGGQTLDATAWAAFDRLKARYPDWADAARAEPAEILALIAEVTHAKAKAAWIVEALRTIIAWRGELSLDFLADLPLEAAFRRLRNLMGVGSKVASSVLNFSSFARPMLVVDSHVARVAHRLGLTSRDDLDRAHNELMALVNPGWDAQDLRELHRLIKRLGQTVCRTRLPVCETCPLAGDCRSRRVVH